MSTLDLSGSKPPSEMQTDHVSSSVSIGTRIMRQLRRNSVNANSNTNANANANAKPDSDLKKKNLNSKAIEKLYLNKTLGRLKHTQLETIFEHEDETDNAHDNFTFEDSNVFGKKKIKRSVSCTDGLNTSKTLKQKRKRRIQKIFGVHKKLKSISMKKFLERLQASDTVTVSAPSALPSA